MNFDKIVGGVGCFTYKIQLDFGADPGILMKFFHCGIGQIVKKNCGISCLGGSLRFPMLLVVVVVVVVVAVAVAVIVVVVDSSSSLKITKR